MTNINIGRLYISLIALFSAIFISMPNAVASPANTEKKGLNALKAAYFRQKYLDPNISETLKLAYLDSLIALHPSDINHLVEQKIELCYNRGMYADVIDACDSLFHSYNNMDIGKKCRFMSLQLSAFSNSGNYGRLAETAPRLLAIPKPDSLCYYDAVAYECVSSQASQLKSASDFSRIRKVEDLLAKARSLSLREYVINRIRKSLYAMQADSARAVGNFKQTLKFQEQLLCLPLYDQERLGVELNIGMTYLQMGEEDMALDIFYRLLDEKPSHRNHGMALVNAMHILNSQKRYDEALKLYNSHEDAAQYLDRFIGLAYLSANRAIAFAGIGKYNEAYPLMSRAMDINDSIRIAMGYREGDLGINVARLSDSIRQISDDRSLYRMWMWIAIALLAMAAVAAYIIFVRLMRTSELCHRLREDHEEILKRSRQTTSNTLKLARVNESMEQIDAICREKGSSPSDKLERISRQIGGIAMLDNAWEVFRYNFEGVHSGFFRRLKEKHPDISDSEMRMCAYVAMHLSSKDIAAITSRTVRSVESMRYRIHKKVGISGKDSLADYLLRLTDPDNL